jgi:hypothetical protein
VPIAMLTLTLPFFRELETARTVLVAGAGGGYDVFCGLPLYFALRAAGKAAFLANLSFTDLESATGRRLAPALLEVTAHSSGNPHYFPELYLARWLRDQGEAAPVYCFDRTGARPVRQAYEVLAGHLGLDAVVLVDGGTDSLMRGDEAGLGTPEEDIVSLAAVADLAVPAKYLVCLGFGVDSFHGVCHAHNLEAVAELTRAGAFLGAFSLTDDMPAVQKYRAAAEAVFRAMPHHPSIVSASILSALEGHYGDHHRTARTAGSTLWINPLMAMYWCFRLEPVARRVLYLELVKATETYGDVMDAINAFRAGCPTTRERSLIPDVSLGRRLSR